MADIQQAAKWMQEGKRVYSQCSQRMYPIYMNEFEIFYQAHNGVKTFITLPDVLANDWEIAE